MYCYKCGKEISDEANFCIHCGSSTKMVKSIHSQRNQRGSHGDIPIQGKKAVFKSHAKTAYKKRSITKIGIITLILLLLAGTAFAIGNANRKIAGTYQLSSSEEYDTTGFFAKDGTYRIEFVEKDGYGNYTLGKYTAKDGKLFMFCEDGTVASSYDYEIFGKDLLLNNDSEELTLYRIAKAEKTAKLKGTPSVKISGRFFSYEDAYICLTLNADGTFLRSTADDTVDQYLDDTFSQYVIEKNVLKLLEEGSWNEYLFELSEDGSKLYINNHILIRDSSYLDKTNGVLQISQTVVQSNGKTDITPLEHSGDGCCYVLTMMFGTEDLKDSISYIGDYSIDDCTYCIFDNLQDEYSDTYIWISNTRPYVVYWGKMNDRLAVLWIDGDGQIFYDSNRSDGTDSQNIPVAEKAEQIESLLNLPGVNGLLHSSYTDVRSIRLNDILQTLYLNPMDDELRNAWTKATGLDASFYYDEAGLPFEFYYITGDNLDALLRKCTGYGISDVVLDLENVTYLPSIDVYCAGTDGSSYCSIDVVSISELDDDIIEITYGSDYSYDSDWYMKARLKDLGNSQYQIISNMPVE